MTPLRQIACLLALVIPTAAFAQNSYLLEYGTKPVPVRNRTGGADTQLYLMGVDMGELILRYDPNSRQEIVIPLDEAGLQLYFAPPKEYNDHIALIEAGRYDRAVDEMRSYAYPLVQYIQLPPENVNFHPILERFIFALSNSSHFDEAIAMMQFLPFDSIDPRYVNYAFTVTERLVDAGRTNDALALLNRLPIDESRAELLPKLMNFANRQREAGNMTEALFLYERIQAVRNSDLADEATLWTAYCNLEMSNVEKAKLFVEMVGPFQPEQAAYALEKLVQGRIYLEQGDDFEAMRNITQGVVAGSVSDSAMPELLYLSATLYEGREKPDVAREIYGEVDLFYTRTSWGEKSRERLAELPAPTPEESTEATQ